MVDRIKELVKQKIGNVNIISIYKVGSQIFCENCEDRDYKVIVDNLETNSTAIFDKENNIDILIVSQKYYMELTNFDVINNQTFYVINDIFKNNYTIYGDNSLDIKLLENADKYKNYLKERLSTFFCRNSYWKNSKNVCSKKFWNVILGLMVIENNSYEITDEMLEIANKCHNYELPKAWEEWVKEKIY